MVQRRRRFIPALARRMSREVRHVSLLTHALHDLRLALHRLGREILVCLAILICLWRVLADIFSQLARLFF